MREAFTGSRTEAVCTERSCSECGLSSLACLDFEGMQGDEMGLISPLMVLVAPTVTVAMQVLPALNLEAGS